MNGCSILDVVVGECAVVTKLFTCEHNAKSVNDETPFVLELLFKLKDCGGGLNEGSTQASLDVDDGEINVAGHGGYN